MSKTLIVNFLAGPGAGKSSLAADTFAALKWANISCELATEFAKDIVWEESTKLLNNQVFVFAQQYQRIFRLLNKVDVIITDAALINSIMYYDGIFAGTLEPLVIDIINSMNNLNFFVERVKPYDQRGRIQSEEEAKVLDIMIRKLLEKHTQSYIKVSGTPDSVDNIIVPKIKEQLALIN